MPERPMQKFSERARLALAAAERESRAHDNPSVGTEHLLLGVLEQQEGIAVRTLESLGISTSEVREQLVSLFGPATPGASGPRPFTPAAKKALELSLREAMQLGRNSIGTEHLLLGVIRESEEVAAQTLMRAGAEITRFRRQMLLVESGDE
jgi:ATP-dependent Clp protease ATP-binding subunit ClpC